MVCRSVSDILSPRYDSECEKRFPNRIVVSEDIHYEVECAQDWRDGTALGPRTEISRWLDSDEAVGEHAIFFDSPPYGLTFYVAFTDLPTATAFRLRFC